MTSLRASVVEISASFTKQLSCLQRIFVYLAQLYILTINFCSARFHCRYYSMLIYTFILEQAAGRGRGSYGVVTVIRLNLHARPYFSVWVVMGQAVGVYGGTSPVLWHIATCKVMVCREQLCVNDSCSSLICNGHLNVRN